VQERSQPQRIFTDLKLHTSDQAFRSTLPQEKLGLILLYNCLRWQVRVWPYLALAQVENVRDIDQRAEHDFKA